MILTYIAIDMAIKVKISNAISLSAGNTKLCSIFDIESLQILHQPETAMWCCQYAVTGHTDYPLPGVCGPCSAGDKYTGK